LRYMVVEHFRNSDPVPVYERFRSKGRLAPEGLHYIESWVSKDLTRCYQLMECEDAGLLDQWMNAWADLVSFEAYAVISSAEASTLVSTG